MPPSKRPAADVDENDASISPPPVKRKARIQSNVTKSAVANFFTPTSQKPEIEARVRWNEVPLEEGMPASLIVGRYETSNKYGAEDPSARRQKIAAFDLDDTLITTASGKTFGNDACDWKWWDHSIPAKLRSMYEDGYRILIFSNQAGITLEHKPSKGPRNPKRLPMWKQKVNAVLTELDIPTTIYAATQKDMFRKPRTKMWEEMCNDYGLSDGEVDKEGSIFVGDAGGRLAQPASGGKKAVAKDFSCSDRNFAHNVGIKYATPEEFFLGEAPRDFRRDFDLSSYPYTETSDVVFQKEHQLELVVLCGPPGAGKSTFYWTYLKPLGYERVNQDQLRTRDKCVKAAKEHLARGTSVVIDNTNPDPDTRKIWVDLAENLANPAIPRCVWFQTPLCVAEHNNAVRAMTSDLNPESRELVPKLAFNSFSSRFRAPDESKERFKQVIKLDFQFRGTEENYSTWRRYWV